MSEHDDDAESLIGHNSASATESSEVLRMQIEKLERLAEEKANVAEDEKDVFTYLKSLGFDVKTVKKILKIRKMDKDRRAEEEALLETYLAALGML